MTMSGNMNHTGRLFLIAGNSGSGKDTLLTEVLARWPASVNPIRIPQCYITRPAHDSDFIIDNSGSLDVSANKLLSYLLTF